MKHIEIPSVASEKCLTTFKFHKNNKGVDLGALIMECQTPIFKANLDICIDENLIKNFIKDLEVVEKERKGSCTIQDEWLFSFTIRSVDSLGHFRVEIWIQDLRESLGNDQIDELKISYEIEPSLLITLVKEFKQLSTS